MKNIFVVGTSGSGKSTLAKSIATSLSARYVEMDELLWMPNWQKREATDFHKKLKDIIAGSNRVVIDGNFLGKDIEPAPGDVLVFLDLPRYLVFSRILRRSIRRVILREKLWAGNREEWKFLVSKDPELNPILFSWLTHGQRSDRYAEYIASRPDLSTYRITSKRELKDFSKTISSL